jgi:hypothetical protein
MFDNNSDINVSNLADISISILIYFSYNIAVTIQQMLPKLEKMMQRGK